MTVSPRLFRVLPSIVMAGALMSALLPLPHAMAKPNEAQTAAATKPKPQAKPKAPLPEQKPAPANAAAAAAPAEPLPPERVEADVSARSIAVTAAFKGTEVTVFGTVDNSRQSSPEAGYYDVIIAVEGAPTAAVVRRKGNVAGLWINTQSATFDRAPSYYAVASTRPLEEIADADVLKQYGIGLDNMPLTADPETTASMSGSELRDYQAALASLKVRDGLFTRDDYGVTFSGRSLFRSTLALPANVPVGQLVTRVYLFKDGQMLNKFTTRVGLERTGVERFIYEAAQNWPWLYGIITVIMALSCGLAASAIFGRIRL